MMWLISVITGLRETKTGTKSEIFYAAKSVDTITAVPLIGLQAQKLISAFLLFVVFFFANP